MTQKKFLKKPILLFLSWRDFQHPQSGGAEVFTTEMLRRAKIKDQYRIIHFSTLCGENEKITRDSDIIYIKKGNWISVLFFAMVFYFKNRKRVSYVVDQCNTHRFFTPLWVPRNKRIFFIHQLTREVWQTKLPKPLSTIGSLAENLMLKIYKRIDTMTVSPSTKSDLKSLGFLEKNIHIIPEGVVHEPVQLPLSTKKQRNVFLYVGRYSEYKGLPDATEAFAELLKHDIHAQFIIIGSKNQKYIDRVLKPLCERKNINISDNYSPDNKRTITLLGRVSEETKLKYMSEVTALIYPSKREGWGLSVSEAAILGTPSIVYNSPGLIDAVNKGKAGYLCKNNSAQSLLKSMLEVIHNSPKYEHMRKKAYHFSKTLRWENTANEFDNFIKEKQSA